MLKKKSLIIVLAAISVMLIGGASAYFTSQDTATNTWTVGNVTIDLLEPNYDASGVENIAPNQELDKDPMIKNTGTNDAFVFMKFTIPKASVSTAADNGTATATALQELFNYSIASEWTQLSNTEEATGNTYVYAYASDNKCTALSTNNITPVLFSDGKIVFKNIVEGQLGSSITIPVSAYAIQTSDVTESNSASPSDVWAVLSRQAGS